MVIVICNQCGQRIPPYLEALASLEYMRRCADLKLPNITCAHLCLPCIQKAQAALEQLKREGGI